MIESIYIWFVLGLFSVATGALALYGLHLYVLLFLFRRRVTSVRQQQAQTHANYTRDRADSDWPIVTTQLPIYNEADVVHRVIQAVVAMDYPAGRHEIQILDDSSDHTREVVDGLVERLREQGVDIRAIRRSDRKGYKAGALAYGMKTARGKHLAIFDADFVPPPDFLRRAIPLLDASDKVACVQGRWAHLNRRESWLTEAQALGIDGHFAIEQGARSWNNLMMNFNGTAGIWRRAAIEDPNVGGWSADTLTEDLDLSYRAQLAGWTIGYSFDIAAPAELPNTIEALKSQQRRWATGSIQVACKLLPRIWVSKISLGEKLEATLHLTHYSVSFWMLVLALVARPVAGAAVGDHMGLTWIGAGWFAMALATFAPSLVYTYARYTLGEKWSGLRTIPSMVVLGCGMCINNSLAIVRGLFLRGGEFVRTPKSGSVTGLARSSSYRATFSRLWIAELTLGVYTLFTFVEFLTSVHQVISGFMLFYAAGFLITGLISMPRRGRESEPTPALPTTPVPVEAAAGS